MKSWGPGETDSTIEFELTADELVRAAEPVFAQTSARPVEAGRSLDGAPSQCLFSRAMALGVSVALAGVLFFGVARQQPSKPAESPRHSPTTVSAHETAAPKILSTSASKPVPVRLANPFDATEVFEFPPGTSLEYARQTVAEFLLDRARDRHVRRERRSRNHRELRNS